MPLVSIEEKCFWFSAPFVKNCSSIKRFAFHYRSANKQITKTANTMTYATGKWPRWRREVKPSCNFCIDFRGRMERSGASSTNQCNKTWPTMTFGECCAIRRHGTVTDSFEEICFANCPWEILGVTGDGWWWRIWWTWLHIKNRCCSLRGFCGCKAAPW